MDRKKDWKRLAITWTTITWTIIIVSSAASSSLAAREEPFAAAARNADQAAAALRAADRAQRAWAAKADARTGLLPQNLTSPLWTPSNSAADLYPFFVLTSYFTGAPLWDKVSKGDVLWGSPAVLEAVSDEAVVVGAYSGTVYVLPVAGECSLRTQAWSPSALWLGLLITAAAFLLVVLPLVLWLPRRPSGAGHPGLSTGGIRGPTRPDLPSIGA